MSGTTMKTSLNASQLWGRRKSEGHWKQPLAFNGYFYAKHLQTHYNAYSTISFPSCRISHRMYHCIAKKMLIELLTGKQTTLVTREPSSLSYLISETQRHDCWKMFKHTQTASTNRYNPLWLTPFCRSKMIPLSLSFKAFCSFCSLQSAWVPIRHGVEYVSKHDVEHICWLQTRRSAESFFESLLCLLFTFLWGGTCKHIRREVSVSVSTCLVCHCPSSYSLVGIFAHIISELFVYVCILYLS